MAKYSDNADRELFNKRRKAQTYTKNVWLLIDPIGIKILIIPLKILCGFFSVME